jgi:hypothetical protein
VIYVLEGVGASRLFLVRKSLDCNGSLLRTIQYRGAANRAAAGRIETLREQITFA